MGDLGGALEGGWSLRWEAPSGRNILLGCKAGFLHISIRRLCAKLRVLMLLSAGAAWWYIWLLLAHGRAGNVDTFLAYRHTQTLEAKKVLMDTLRGGKSTEDVLEEMRKDLVGMCPFTPRPCSE